MPVCSPLATAFQAWYQVMIGRIVAGLGVGALSAAVPVYQSETVPKQIRGTLIATYQLMVRSHTKRARQNPDR